MTDADTTRPHVPYLLVDLEAVNDRYDAMSATDSLASLYRAAFRCALDVPSLASEVDRLYELLLDIRRDHADLAAAAWAALDAEADGEDDPLSYLRDELTYGRHPGTEACP